MTARLHREPALKKVYLEVDGVRWRVHDCTFGAGKFTRCPTTPHSRASCRVFVSDQGVKKAYDFTRGENKELTESRVAAQLSKAGFLGVTGAFDSSTRSPT